MRERPVGILALYFVGVFAALAPLVAAGWLAQHQALLREQERAATLAERLVQRSDKIAQQLERALTALKATHVSDPCSNSQLELMRALVIRSNLVIDVGYVQGDSLMCSAFGREAVPVGAPNYVSDRGYAIRVGVQHPLAPDARLIIATDPSTGYSGMASQDLTIDELPQEENLIGGIIGVHGETILSERGSFNPGWLHTIGNSTAITFYDGANVVAWKRSSLFDYAAFAAIGRRRVEQGQHQILLVLLPLGIAAAALLSYVIVRLARLQTSMPSLLRSALKARKEFFLVYQPIVDLQTDSWCGAEALLRWRRPTGELICPDIFIPIAERSHLMTEITDTVLALLESEADKLLRLKPEFHIAVNLSAEDFCAPDIVDRLRSVIERMGISHCNLQVEATERVFMNIQTSRENLQRLRAAQIKVSIDDFGTGYSSLSYLHSLEADCLKIDKSFVDTIGTQSVTSEVVRHIIEMARSLKMEMVAEGVETEAQADFLRAQGVQYGQGWLFAKPMPMEHLLQQVRSREKEQQGPVLTPGITI